MNINHAEIAKRLLTDKSFTIDLKDLEGEYELSGVSMDTAEVKESYGEGMEDCCILSFVLDNITFTAIENPDDGYRSSCRDILVEKYQVRNRFQPVDVKVIYRKDNSHLKEEENFWNEDYDIIEIYDKANNEIILRAGTSNVGDYYPSYTANWNPEKMSINQ